MTAHGIHGPWPSGQACWMRPSPERAQKVQELRYRVEHGLYESDPVKVAAALLKAGVLGDLDRGGIRS